MNENDVYLEKIKQLESQNANLKGQVSELQGALLQYKMHLENALGRLVITEFKRDHKNEFKKIEDINYSSAEKT